MKNLKFNLKSKSIVQKSTRWLLTLITLLTLGVGNVLADNGWYSDGTWQIWVWPGSGNDTWKGPYGKESNADWGVIETGSYYIKGVGVNTWGSGVTSTEFYFSLNGKTYGGTIGTGSSNGNYYWENKSQPNPNVDIIANAANNPGSNTITCYFKYNGGNQFERNITYTIPGFTSLSTTSVTFDNTTVDSNSSKSITYIHYGTAPTNDAARYSITGTNANQFSITALDGTGATIRFAPTSAGTKTAKLVINDVHGKTTEEITLTGKTQYTVSYNKGSYGTGDNTTANKVYGTNLTLLGATFTRTGFVQTAWNTNADGTSGTSYALNGTYSNEAELTLYPTWTQYTITEVSISPDEISPSTPTDITFSFKTNAPTDSEYKFRIKELTPSASAYGAGYEANDQTLTKTSPNAQTYVKTAVSRTAGTYKTQIELYKGDWSIATSDITLTVGSGGGGGGSSTWYWIDSNGAHNGSEDGITKAEFTETATAGVYTLTRELTQNQQFHLGDGSKGYGPQTPANSDHTNVTATSSNINLAEYGPVYWFTFTPATQQVMMTLNTNDMTISFANPSYTITYKDQGDVTYSGTNGGSLPSSYTYGTGIAALTTGVKAGYTFGGWYDNSSCTGDAVTSIGTTATGAKTLYAKWTENITTVDLVANPENAGTFTCGGSAVTSVSAGVDTKPSVTAVPATGYYVKTGSTVWTKGDNDNNITLSSTTTNPTIVTGVGANGSSSTLTATFSEKYVLRGSTKNSDSNTDGLAGWAATDNSSYVSHSISNGVMTIVAYLTSASTDYKFKIYKVQATETYYGQTGSSGYMPDNEEWTLDGSNDVYFTTTIAGDYTFVVDVTGTYPKVKILFPGEPEYSTTVQTDGTPNASVSVSSVNLKPSTGTEISATVPAGYRFGGWTSSGGGISFTNPYSPTTTVTASSEGGTITANFTTDGMIYLKKTGINGPWPGKVWVYFYTGPYWDNNMGSGSKNALCREMTRLGQTDIYYYNYGDDAAVTSSYINSHVISFTDQYLKDADKFYACSAIYRTDFNTCATMFVVENYITDRKNNSAYYNNGYWMKYNSTDPSVTLHIWKKANNSLVGEYALSSVVAGSNEFKANVTLDGNTEYYFKLSTCNGQWYGNNGTMTTTNSTGWDFLARNNNNCYITTTASASYPFTITCTDVGVLKVSVEFPLAIGDYRVMYYGKMNSLGGASNVNHPSRFVRGLSAAGTKKDMVSFFAIAGDNEWTLQLQKCSAVSPEVLWDNVGSAITSLRSSVSETGVHNFVVEQSHDGSTNTVNVTYGGKYSGNYYIRTDCAAGGWEAYKETADNQMTYSDVAKESGYDYYYCHWVETPRNIQFTVANDYSEAITENYVRETESEKLHITNYINSDGTLNGRDANVRFMYNSSNNYIGRAYIDGANESDNNFLKLLSSDGKLYSGETGGASLSELKFSDNGNWIYEADVYSLPDAQIKLRSNFGTSPNEVVQWFKGGESETVKLIGGTGTSRYKIRVVYDFKTNRLVSAWLPSGTLTSDQDDIYSDIMFIREHQGDIEQVTFNNHRIDDVQKVYGVMRFTKETLNNSSLSEYTRRYYYISFPYDVDLNEAFGFGQYAQHWIICEYNGSRRASEGFWADSESHWEYIWDRKGVILEKNTGYLLELELSALGESSSIWDNTSTVELYFPSKIDVQTIQPHQVQVDVPSHLCTIGPRFAGGDDRRFKDSHWNLVGVPTYVNESPTGGWDETSDDYKNWVIGDQTWPAGNTWATTANYLYEYQFNDNTWRAVSSSGYVFHAMHAYLMQYAGTLVFNAANSTPSQIAAHRNANYKGKYEFRLELQQNGVMADQTYISLLDVENITTGFDFNSDLSKEFNGNKPNIYTQITTVIDNEVSTTKAAGNCLPLETESVTTVPVGVRVKEPGTYTFSMPDGTEGMAVTLLDSETGVHTDLSVEDYTVELQAGSCDGRFYISIDPRNAATQIDVVGGEGDELRNAKILRNGMLFIQRGETLYDATGKRLN